MLHSELRLAILAVIYSKGEGEKCIVTFVKVACMKGLAGRGLPGTVI